MVEQKQEFCQMIQYKEKEEKKEILEDEKLQTYETYGEITTILEKEDEYETYDPIENILSEERNFGYVKALEKGDSITEEDAKIIAKVQSKMNEKIKAKVKTTEHKLIGILTKCYIDGCEFHSITSTGSIIDHYSSENDSSLDKRLKTGAKIWKSNPYSTVEVYTDYIAVISDGKTKVIKEDE